MFRESTRTDDREVAERLLQRRISEIKRGDTRDIKVPVGYVYFLQELHTSNIKIGFSSNLAARTAEISGTSASGARLIAKVPGTMQTEKALQKAFRKYRSHGKWFYCRGELSDFIRLIAE